MKKSNVFDQSKEVTCSVCGKNLMKDPEMGLLNIIQNNQNKIVHIHACCKGNCDRIISSKAKKDEISGWKDLTEFINPYLYIKHVMSVMNSMFDGEGFENEEAFENYKQFILSMYPYVTRNMSDEENRAVELDSMIPF